MRLNPTVAPSSTAAHQLVNDERNHGDGGSYIKTLLRDTKNAAVEGGATMLMIHFLGLCRDGFTVPL